MNINEIFKQTKPGLPESSAKRMRVGEPTQPKEDQTRDLIAEVNRISAILRDDPGLRADKERISALTKNSREMVYQASADILENPEVKKVETTLRNLGILNRGSDPNFVLEIGGEMIHAHKSILALESPYFNSMESFKESQENKLEMMDTGVLKEAIAQALDYLYLSDEEREKLISTLDKQRLIEMTKLADLWQIDSLKEQSDEELCNSIGQLNIDKGDINDWLEQANVFPKFAQLLGFINRVAGEGDLGAVIDQMETVEGASQLASKCTPEEIAAFATLKTEFGKECQMPKGAFGKAEWEKAFPVTIEEVPPLPAHIHAILEQEDPCEPGKTLKETCTLFLRPKKVILHEEEGDKELLLSFDGVEELAKKATNPDRRTQYRFRIFDHSREQMNRMPVAESGWVLMRKGVIPGTRGRRSDDLQQFLKGDFEVPKLMDAVLLNTLTYAREGRYLYGQDPWTFTRCQEQFQNYRASVGGFGPSGLLVVAYNFGVDDFGLSGAWKL